MKIGQEVYVVLKTNKKYLHIISFYVISFDETVVMVVDGLGREKFAIHKLEKNEVFVDKAQADSLMREIEERRDNMLIHNKVLSTDRFSAY